jgi:hypothetical protein
MRKFVTLVLISFLTGCVVTSTGDKQLTESGKILLQESAGIAVRRYLREHPDQVTRTANIKAVIARVQQATAITTLGELKAIAATEISARINNPLDRADALALLNVFEVVIKEQVGDKIDSKTLVRVNEILGYIVAALPS